MTREGRSARGRLRVIAVDQAVAGGSNVLIAVLAARLLDTASFGFFSLVFLVYTVEQGVARALIGDPLLIHPIEAERRRAEVIGAGCVLGIGLGGLVLACSFAARGWDVRLGDALVVLAACAPLLVLQDLGRYLGFATHRPSAALVLDGAWLVMMLPPVAALFILDVHSLTWFIAAWGGAGAGAGLLVFGRRGGAARFTLNWLRETWSYSWRYLVSYTSTQGSALAASAGIGGVAGPRALGGIQGATLLVRPFAMLQTAAVASGVADISRGELDNDAVWRMARKLTTLTSLVAVVNATVMLLLPDNLGRLVLGDTWSAAQPLLLATAVQIISHGLMTGARAGLLGTRSIRKAMVVDVASTVVVLGASVAGAVVNGALGAVWAVAVGQAVLTVVWWFVLWQHITREPRRHSTLVGTGQPAG